MALAWKAGWVQALRGSNPLSSAIQIKSLKRFDCSGSGWGLLFIVPIYRIAYDSEIGPILRHTYLFHDFIHDSSLNYKTCLASCR